VRCSDKLFYYGTSVFVTTQLLLYTAQLLWYKYKYRYAIYLYRPEAKAKTVEFPVGGLIDYSTVLGFCFSELLGSYSYCKLFISTFLENFGFITGFTNWLMDR
jgi:hypothetical protein